MYVYVENSYRRINLGPLMDGRNVSLADFTGNGLLDIFIVCVHDSHLLLLQIIPGVFEEVYISNTTALAGGEARGIAIGRLYNNTDTIEVTNRGVVLGCVFTARNYLSPICMYILFIRL